VTFKLGHGRPGTVQGIGCEAGSLAQRDAYREVGALAAMRGKDKVFALDRRGGYPWAVGFFNRNDTAPLPAAMNGRLLISGFTSRTPPRPGLR